MVNLKEYICSVPFNGLEIHDNSAFMCCASWLTKPLPKNGAIKDLWKSEEAKEIRKSVTDGSYRFCDKKLCPYLSELQKFNRTQVGPVKHINQVSDEIKNYIENGEDSFTSGPTILQMSFDRTCNYKCPSCRVDMIVASSEKIKTINLTIDEIEEAYSNSIETIYCSGTADPFASVSYRNFLRNFNPKKYPNLKSIHLHTNASLWNKEMWDTMPNIHKYVRSCEISIDAGTQNTYENVTRLGGNWDNLLNNLRFISTIKSIRNVKCSFVVQQSNYNEMSTFFDLIRSIFGKKTKVFYGRLTNWGTFSNEMFKFLDVADETHPEHSFFLEEFNKVAISPFVFHNLHDFIEKKETKLI
jgi:hypothetical protein